MGATQSIASACFERLQGLTDQGMFALAGGRGGVSGLSAVVYEGREGGA